LTRFTGQRPWRSGGRVLSIGGAAGVLGWSVGNAIRWLLG
jgi:hypothetical protein